MNFDNISDLDYWVSLGCWEFSSNSRALYVKTQNTERRDLLVLAFAREALNIVEIQNVEFNLAVSFLLIFRSNLPLALFNFDPSHAANFTVNHESESVGHIALISRLTQYIFTRETHSFLDNTAQLGYKFGVRNVYLQKLLFFFLVVHDWVFVDHINLDHCIVAVDS